MENNIPSKNRIEPRTGASKLRLHWVERQNLVEMAAQLKGDPELEFDWLEHLSVMTMDDLLVASYFLRSFGAPQRKLVLRTTVTSGAGAKLASVRSVWPMAVPFEAEMTERFGITFTLTTSEAGAG